MPSSSDCLRWLTACLLSAGASHAHADWSQSCPVRVHVEGGQVRPADLPSGARGQVSDAALMLTGISAYDGPPEQGAALKPSTERRDTSTWLWQGSFDAGKWVSCDYAQGLVHVAFQIDAALGHCTGSFKLEGSPRQPKGQFRCW